MGGCRVDVYFCRLFSYICCLDDFPSVVAGVFYVSSFSFCPSPSPWFQTLRFMLPLHLYMQAPSVPAQVCYCYPLLYLSLPLHHVNLLHASCQCRHSSGHVTFSPYPPFAFLYVLATSACMASVLRTPVYLSIKTLRFMLPLHLYMQAPSVPAQAFPLDQ